MYSGGRWKYKHTLESRKSGRPVVSVVAWGVGPGAAGRSTKAGYRGGCFATGRLVSEIGFSTTPDSTTTASPPSTR